MSLRRRSIVRKKALYRAFSERTPRSVLISLSPSNVTPLFKAGSSMIAGLGIVGWQHHCRAAPGRGAKVPALRSVRRAAFRCGFGFCSSPLSRCSRPQDRDVLHYDRARSQERDVLHYDRMRSQDRDVLHYDRARSQDGDVLHSDRAGGDADCWLLTADCWSPSSACCLPPAACYPPHPRSAPC